MNKNNRGNSKQLVEKTVQVSEKKEVEQNEGRN